MPFTVEDFRDLIELLERRPEWRTDLRRLVLTNELLALPEQLAMLRVRSEEQFQALVEAQQRTESRLEALTVRVEALAIWLEVLAPAHQRLEEQMTRLVVAQQQTEARLVTLTEQMTVLVAAQQRTDTRVATLIDDVGELKGDMLEARYRTRGQTYFRRIVRRAHVLTADEMTTLIDDAQDQSLLSEAEADDLSEIDLLVRGRRSADGTTTYLAVEVSWGVGAYDVERAVRRAALLAHTGVITIPVVAGTWITPEAAQFAYHAQVWQLIEGRANPPASETVSS